MFGRTLEHPVGLAAGFDKNGRVFRRMYDQGFSFVEIGGVTPRAQAGNPRPRVFRLAGDRAVINKMGFPNDGADAVLARLAGPPAPGMFGINLASNADSSDPGGDFVDLVRRFTPFADYLTLDISCPNTENGQVFLDPEALRAMLARLAAIDGPGPRPALVAKLSPDNDDARLQAIVRVLLEARIDGIAVANTTAQRPPLRDDGSPPGGLSGQPLFELATTMLRRVDELVDGAVPLIGIGGIAGGRRLCEDPRRRQRRAALHRPHLRGNGTRYEDRARACRILAARRFRIGPRRRRCRSKTKETPRMNLLIRLLLNAVALYAIAYFHIIPGVGVTSLTGAVVAALVLGVVNAIIRPILILLALPLEIITLGLFTFVINALLFWFVGSLNVGLVVSGFVAALLGSIVLSIVSFILANVFAPARA